MRSISFKGYVSTIFIAFALGLLGGCGGAKAETKDPLGDLRNQLRSIEQKLSANESRLVALENQLAKTTEGLTKVSQSTADSVSVKQLTAIHERLAIMEKVGEETRAELGRIRMGSQRAAETAKPARMERTKENLLAALERGYRKAVSSGLSQESKLKVLGQYQYFKKKVDNGEDPRVTFELLATVDAESVNIIRMFFPECMPEE